jgi:creatinine amidohydrolase
MSGSGLGTAPYEWAGLPYREIQRIAAQDGSLVVVPVGSVEQHGHHLPVATDTILVEAIVDGGVERVADDVPVVVTPPVWSGFSPHHLSLGGTLSLEFEHMRTLLEDVAGTALDNGFDAAVFVNGHGGNTPMIDAVVSTVGSRTDAEVSGTTYFELATDTVGELRDSDTGGMAHGGEFETSLMLYLRPELVADPSEREAALWDEHYERAGQDLLDGGPLSVYRPFEDYSETGAIGAPEAATADKGERIHAAVTAELAATLQAVHEHNR